MTQVDETLATGSSVRLLAGRYQVGERIGKGGMSDVHLGTDARLGRRVAIKLLKPQLANDPTFRTRFRREAQDAAKMAHPTIVRIYDAGEETITESNGREVQLPFIVMEYVDGRLLKDLISDGPLPLDEATRIVEQVLLALEYSHRAGVVHRDIKPGNIMVTKTGQVKVMDFGIARAVSDASATIAQTSAIVGTAQYFSPEQARGEVVDARTDLYSTGVVLFELLTGRPPFSGRNPVAVAYQHINQAPTPPSAYNPKVSPALDAVVLRSLVKDRADRYQSASEFRHDVELAASGQVPTRKAPQDDFNATIFGVNPTTTAGATATLRQLSVDTDERVRGTQTRPPVAWIWSGIVVMAAIVAAVVFWVFNLSPQGPPATANIEVPAVVGMTQDEAVAELDAAGLTYEIHARIDPEVPSGEVISTTPEAGIGVLPDYTVGVYVSSGPQLVNVPDVASMPENEARDTITRAGFTAGNTVRENHPNVPRDVVIRTDPPANNSLAPGGTVNFVVSTGNVEVPDVVGLGLEQAQAELTDQGLIPQIESDTGCSGGTVSGQSIAPGAAPQGSTVAIRVCNG